MTEQKLADIVTRLRYEVIQEATTAARLAEAADEIERLRANSQEAIEVAREPTAAMLDAMQAECPEIGRHYLRAIWRAGFAALQPSVAEPPSDAPKEE